MSVTLVINTQFGSIPSGSILVVPIDHAKELIEKYGSNLSISAQHPGIYWYQDGNTLTINGPKVGAAPIPVYDFLPVLFTSGVSDPILGEISPGDLLLFPTSDITSFLERRPEYAIQTPQVGEYVQINKMW